jgi:PPOX class probable F420-dependent enzyme
MRGASDSDGNQRVRPSTERPPTIFRLIFRWPKPAACGLPSFSGVPYRCRVRKNLPIEELGSFLDDPRVAVLATLRVDGSVLLSPVWHEWRDGGFNLWIDGHDAKARHMRRDPRATIVVAESEKPLRGVELRTTARFVEEGVNATARRIATRYLGSDEGAAYADAHGGSDVIVRLQPGRLRVWDFVDEYGRG